VLRRIVDSQIRWSYAAVRRLSPQFTVDGYSDFAKHIVPAYLRPGQVVYDVVGGKCPYVNAESMRNFPRSFCGAYRSS